MSRSVNNPAIYRSPPKSQTQLKMISLLLSMILNRTLIQSEQMRAAIFNTISLSAHRSPLQKTWWMRGMTECRTRPSNVAMGEM